MCESVAILLQYVYTNSLSQLNGTVFILAVNHRTRGIVSNFHHFSALLCANFLFHCWDFIYAVQPTLITTMHILHIPYTQHTQDSVYCFISFYATYISRSFLCGQYIIMMRNMLSYVLSLSAALTTTINFHIESWKIILSELNEL